MHLKRKTIKNFWPVPKSGTKYLAGPSHEQNNSVSLMVMAREVLKIVKTKKELKKLLNEKKIVINGKTIKEINYPLCLFDTLGFPTINKYYGIKLKKKIIAEEISKADSLNKVYKVLNKKLLPGKKVQINMNQGRNIISNEKINAGDFALIDLAKNKILKVIPLKKDTPVLVVAGKHMGKEGKIKDIIQEGSEKSAIIKTKEEEIKANIKNIFAKE